MRTKLKWAFGGVILIILVVAALVGARDGKALASVVGKGTVSVRFVGYSNDASSKRLATFTVSNQGSRNIWRFRQYNLEVQQQKGAQSSWFARQALPTSVSLAARASEVVLVPVPTVDRPWRVVLTCSRDGWRRKLNASRTVNPVLPDRLRGVPTEDVASNWIDP
jgi:hypothetical protein